MLVYRAPLITWSTQPTDHMATMGFAVPLAALAALLTLLCSGYLLSQTGWQKTARYRIEMGTTTDSTSASLAEYMQGGQGVASTAIAAASAAVSAVTSLDAPRSDHHARSAPRSSPTLSKPV